MVKLRVQGLPEEVAAFCDAMEAAGVVLERSDAYANRGNSKYVRVYMEVEGVRPDVPEIEGHEGE